MKTETIELPSLAPGASFQLKMCTFGSGRSSRSAYVQAGLHADEHPGLLVAHHLMRLLTDLERKGQIAGTVVVCPFANPVGLGQRIFGMPTGRFNLENGENFNRAFPEIASDIAAMSGNETSTGNDVALVKRLFAQLLERHRSDDTVGALKFALLREALKHDLVLDLHCDTAGVLHLYANRAQAARAELLARAMGISTVLVEDHAGGRPFDESFTQPWRTAVEAGLIDPHKSGFCASIELRGQGDVDDATALEDARGILRFLVQEQLIEPEGGDAGGVDFHPLSGRSKELDRPDVFPLEGASHLRAPATGIVVYRKHPGDRVSYGELLAEIVALDGGPDTARAEVRSDVDGVFLVGQHFRFVRVGQRVALLAGAARLPGREPGKLLNDF
ncbi:succinylglutamate desuccinylase/aspartoacylase family protein [Paraburkholderia sp. RCC_158]|uniref:succinylglutamate desuccinylase/aspartoacylase family protein n=1 Tax=Paraburkholderia sp. RCC_158 TaxID=3239220 RepID=UPI00352580DB